MSHFIPDWATDHCEVMPGKTREDWLENRSHVVTGTDISAIMGENPYCSRFDLWLQKTGQGQDIQDNDAMRIGRICEPGMRQDASDRYGMIYEAPGCLQSKRWPIMGGTPDGLREGIPWIFEFKTAGIRNSYSTLKLDQTDWGDEMTDQVPPHYLYQCMWYMGLTGADQCQLIAMIGGHGVREYTIPRDNELIDYMVEAANEFWEVHVAGNVQPDIQYSPQAEDWIKRRYWHADKDKVIEGDQIIDKMVELLRTVRALKKDNEDDEKQLIIEIKQAMGDAYKIKSPHGSVTYAEVKGRTTVDWKALAEDLKISEDDIARYTRQGKPSRQFRFTPKK